MLRFVVVSASLLLSLASSASGPDAPPTPTPTTTTPTTPTTPKADVVAIVNEQLLQPLRDKDSNRSKMSRAMPAPQERRVRVTDDAPRLDTDGKAFLAFAVDDRRGWGLNDDDTRWQENAIVGCVYPDTSTIYVNRGEQYVPAAALLGAKQKMFKPTAPLDHVCTPDTAQAALSTTTTTPAPAPAG